jgi:hypothetical protein
MEKQKIEFSELQVLASLGDEVAAQMVEQLKEVEAASWSEKVDRFFMAFASGFEADGAKFE